MLICNRISGSVSQNPPLKGGKKKKNNQKVAHYQNLRTWSGDKIKIFM